jgi:hypothetical protein
MKRTGCFFLQQDRKEDGRLLSPKEPEEDDSLLFYHRGRRQDAFFSNRTGYVASGLALEWLEGLHQEVLQVLKQKQVKLPQLYSRPIQNIETKYMAASVRCATISLDNDVQDFITVQTSVPDPYICGAPGSGSVIICTNPDPSPDSSKQKN